VARARPHMAKCTRCGNELPDDALFCPQCAQRVVVQSAASAAAVAVATISDVRTIVEVSVAKPAASLAPGDLFHGRYVIEQHVGAGAMGVVYAAKDQVTNRAVALKLINPVLADRPMARERFLREGLMARDIRHPNIVAMYDVGDVDGQLYLVMEYLAGETLRKWLRRTLQEGRDIAFDTARGIIRRVLEGLAAAHATGVVHRDLKPENVMLTGDPHDGTYSLKILDFGIARAVGTASHVTTTSSSTGTPLYMAPEQKTAADTVGPPADLYAVTAMLYELLLGVAPEGRWSAPSRERGDLPPGIDPVIETGLASRPRSRYQSADEYIKALDAIGVVAPVLPAEPPMPAPPPTEAGKPEKRGIGSDWLKARSPAWALWDRLSKKQRYLLMALSIVAGLGILAYNVNDSVWNDLLGLFGVSKSRDIAGGNGGAERAGAAGGGANADTGAATGKGLPTGVGSQAGKGAVATAPQGTTVTPPTAPPRPVFLAGRWSDSLRGAVVNLGYVDIAQDGEAVTGVLYNAYGYQVGTLVGRVQGRTLQYDYLANNGMTGTGRGQLSSDDLHLNLDIQNHQTGYSEQHTLHKNHLPHQ
ncbi:MAG: serine/threonine-protein kinase, partial [Bacteroidales bacterium]